MADLRRTKKSRVSRLKGGAPRASGIVDDTLDLPDSGDGHDDEDAERVLGRTVATLVPVVGVGGAVAVGALSGLAPAILLLAGATLLGTIAFFWASLRTLSGDAPLPEGVGSHSIEARAAAPERKREALRALKDLELEHAIGKIDDADYLELSTHYRGVAKSLMRALDRGLAPRREEAERLVTAYLAKKGLGAETLPPPKPVVVAVVDVPAAPAAPSAVPATRLACPRCGVSNEPDAAFCKACAGPLASPLASSAEESDASA
jgi:hypothetical protein